MSERERGGERESESESERQTVGRGGRDERHKREGVLAAHRQHLVCVCV